MQAFRAHGATDARIITDRETGRSKGFGFVGFGTADEANRAMDAMQGSDLEGRAMRIQLATSGGPKAGGAGGGDRGGYGAFIRLSATCAA